MKTNIKENSVIPVVGTSEDCALDQSCDNVKGLKDNSMDAVDSASHEDCALDQSSDNVKGLKDNSMDAVVSASHEDCALDQSSENVKELKEHSMDADDSTSHEDCPLDLSTESTSEVITLPTIFYSSVQNSELLSWIESLKHKKFTANTKDNQGIPEFHLSCTLSEPALAQSFIANGANVNSQVPPTSQLNPGFTPLHFAVKSCSIKVIYLLLVNYADPNKADATGSTPLHLAFEQTSSLNSVSMSLIVYLLLVVGGANPIIADENGRTPVHKAFYLNKTDGSFDFFNELIKVIEWGLNNHTDEHGLSLFHLASSKGLLSKVKDFLDSGVNVNSRVSSGPYSGFTALHFATMFNWESVVRHLLDREADVNAKEDVTGGTPLHLACRRLHSSEIMNSINAIRMLLDFKARPDVPDKNGRTPLHECFYGQTNCQSVGSEAFLHLLSKTVWKFENHTDDQGLSLFHIVCSTRDLHHVKAFMKFAEIDVDSCPSSGKYSGFTPLHFAVMYNHAEVVKFLLERNANVNMKAGETGVTPLHLACEFSYRKFIQHESAHQCCAEQMKIIDLLLSRKADVDAKDSLGVTPLLYACTIDKNHNEEDWDYLSKELPRIANGFYEEVSLTLEFIIRSFISNKVDVNARTDDQSTILHLVCKYSVLRISEKLMKLIILEGVDLNAVNDAGLTALHVAVKSGKKRLVKCLLNHNADPDIKCNESAVPLHIVFQQIIDAIREGTASNKNGNKDSIKNKMDIFVALLENGCDVNIRKRNGGILLHEALKESNFNLIKNLLKHGADMNMKDSLGNCFTHYLLHHKGEPKLAHLLKCYTSRMTWLKALETPISEKAVNYPDKLCSEYKRMIDESAKDINTDLMVKKRHAELTRMKAIKIESCTTLYDIVKRRPQDLTYLVENENLINIVKARDLCDKFPFYGHFLKIQFKRGLIRRRESAAAEAALCNVMNFNVPNLCCQVILKYLANDDLHKLIEVPLKRNLKRKLCDDQNEAGNVSRSKNNKN